MKLLNPVGREVAELEAEAYSCHCYCSSGSYSAKIDGDSSDPVCECDDGTTNLNSNYDIAADA